MLKKIAWLALLISFICSTAPYAKAATIDYVMVWRDNIVYETGAFTGVQNIDTMKASAELSSVPDPNDYSVHLTSGVSGPVDTDLGSYRDHGGGSYEYVNTDSLAAPGPSWEGFTYTFDLFNVSDPSLILGTATWTIPAGSVINPVAIPTWTSFSGDLLNPTISWEATIAPSEGKYKLRIYELNPDGSFNYQAITHSTPQFETTTYTLDDFTLEYGKSYAIGIQSIIIHPNAGGTLNRSQYYIRYDTIAPATIILTKVKIKFKDEPVTDEFEVKGEFILGEDSDGIDLFNDSVEASVDSFNVVIPANSFIEKKLGEYKFKGTVDGIEVDAKIKEIDTDTFEFKVKAKGFDLTGTTNVVNVKLLVGDDAGTAYVRLTGDLKFDIKKQK